jgi:hypothetical protein
VNADHGVLAVAPSGAGAAASSTTRRAGPVIVMCYPYAGAGRLGSLLSQRQELACTSGTGLLPLCDQAALTWQQAERRLGPASALALASIRAFTGTVITTLLAREGTPRWCEITTASPASAETFLRVY